MLFKVLRRLSLLSLIEERKNEEKEEVDSIFEPQLQSVLKQF